MKIALVLSANIWSAPYISIYTKILKQYNVEYDIINWNRDLSEYKSELSWNVAPKGGKFSKFWEYYRFSRYVKNRLLKDTYDRIVIFGPVMPIYLQRFLKVNFENKYLIDIRDLGIEQLPLFKNIYAKAVKYSALNSVSSPGFIEYLPKADYVISHNFDIEQVANSLKRKTDCVLNKKIVEVLTIGQIRNFESNIQIVDSLKNDSRFHLSFRGGGDVQNRILSYVKEHSIKNVDFSGRYNKCDELKLIQDSTFINILMPPIKSHSSLMSNRFYNALIMRKPMIVASNSIQGDLVREYNLGIVVGDCSSLKTKILSFLGTFDKDEYYNRCNDLLKKFVDDYNIFEKRVVEFITYK